ncbi:phage tail protein [Zooshikella sp. WH53]|uniref:Phage tail protein n=1 Tax=Zooshikella harenae TaxID=2827238 RepID=A0ABS5ZJI0_9GAMM|nr:phage tail protein [Zooshikella harenae]
MLTDVGQARIINAHALGKTVKLTTLKVGDGGEDGGKETSPQETDTHLVRVRWQGPINSIYQDEQNKNWLVSETVIPEQDGNFYITEFGLYDDEDNLIVVGRYPKTYKPRLDQGSGSSLYLKVIFELSNTKTVELKIDPAIVLASRQYVDRSILAHEQKADPHPQYVQKDIYNVEKKFTGTPGEIGSVSRCVLQGIIYQTTTFEDTSPPRSDGDFPTIDLKTEKNVYCHFVTPFNLNQHNHMFLFNVRGYSYGSTKEIYEAIVGYCYAIDKKLLSSNTRGNCSPALYVDKYGNIIFSLFFASIYYTTIVIDSLLVGNGRTIYRGEMKAVLSLQDKIDYPRN